LVVPENLDTDQFGTFSGEVARRTPAIDAARNKARLGMGATGLSHGLASEASYGPTGHEEILIFIDDVRGMEVAEMLWESAEYAISHRVRSVADLPPSVTSDLVEQAVIVRPSDSYDGVVKGITDRACLRRAVATAARRATDRLAIVEPDLRAHHNTRRQQVLRRLSYRLARRLATRCPGCGTPGFGRVCSVGDVPCAICRTPTPLPILDVHGCSSCAYRHSVRVGKSDADPGLCTSCNP